MVAPQGRENSKARNSARGWCNASCHDSVQQLEAPSSKAKISTAIIQAKAHRVQHKKTTGVSRNCEFGSFTQHDADLTCWYVLNIIIHLHTLPHTPVIFSVNGNWRLRTRGAELMTTRLWEYSDQARANSWCTQVALLSYRLRLDYRATPAPPLSVMQCVTHESTGTRNSWCTQVALLSERLRLDYRTTPAPPLSVKQCVTHESTGTRNLLKLQLCTILPAQPLPETL